MKSQTILRTLVGAVVVVAVSLFLTNGTLLGYKLLGFNLGLSQRDFRVYNNFVDSTANDNQVVDPNFPGSLGATMACWKGCIEWGSEQMGTSGWGAGGANFDPVFVGEANKIGTTNSNIMSSLDQYGGNVIAFTYCSSAGWQMRFYDQPWVWHDGPGNTSTGGSRMDIQGITAHEYGHSLGLDHTSSSSATMYAYASGAGNSLRTIENDDINGLKAIYGSASASKPSISSLAGSFNVGEILTIYGVNFSPTGNEVWFTGDGSAGKAVKATNISSSNNGTRIDVVIPSGAKAGTVLVRSNGTSHSNLSNNYPLDVGSGGGSTDPVPDIKIDGQDGPLNVPHTQTVRIHIYLDPGDEIGVAYDWWIFGELNWSIKYWWKPMNRWVQSVTPVRSYDGDLFDVVDFTIAQGKLPAGSWTFTFAVDTLDGNYDGTYIDTISIQSY
jgi:hypothetical protein